MKRIISVIIILSLLMTTLPGEVYAQIGDRVLSKNTQSPSQTSKTPSTKPGNNSVAPVYNLPDINLGSYGLGVKGEAPGISLKDVKMAVNGTVGIGQ
ncbi:MAG: hypothetical protein FWF35_05770, partial [Elusimicrobia bacterium]|nr:hypothetical protein [Elusimicrobiota bacterium]